MSEDYVLELEHIRKEYPGVVALKDVTLQLRRGEVLGLIGENGVEAGFYDGIRIITKILIHDSLQKLHIPNFL